MLDLILQHAKDLVAEIQAYIDNSAPPPPPPVIDNKIFTVTSDKALARFIYGYNQASKPIMQIYPGDSIVEGRVKYLKGDKIEVHPTPVLADGGAIFYEMANSVVEDFALFLRAQDGTVV